MKVAICFWGLTRSLKYTIDSIENKIFNIFKSKNVDYDVFLHSFYFEGNLNISYTSEKNVKLDFDEYKLLKPKYYKIDNQDEVIKTIDFKKYMYQDRCHNNMQMLRNAVLSLYSQKEVTKLVKNTNIKYDYIIFLRPDCKFLDNFNVGWFRLSKKIKVLTPRFGQSGGLNNRMFAGNYEQGILFGHGFDYLEEYTNDRIFISEKFTRWLVKNKIYKDQKNLKRFINFRFQRIRADGTVAKLDRKL